MKKLILTERQFKQYINLLKEDYASMYSSSTTSTPRANALPSNSNGKTSGSVTMKKRDANPDNIKKYTDKGININIIDENSDFLKKYFGDSATLTEKMDKGFSIDTLEHLESFKDRESYCKQHLKFLGEGSSRLVFDLNDGEYVLKLAKNVAGLKQNAVEATTDTDYHEILANCKYYDYTVGYVLFVIMEKASSINEGEFKILTDIDFKSYQQLFAQANTSKSNKVDAFTDLLYNLAYEEIGTDKSKNFSENLQEYIYESKLNAIGDLGRIENFGKVDRNGKDTIVLVDFGMDDQTFNDSYKK